jgi:hypothetical protein
MFKWYIVSGGFAWGGGTTLEEAKKNWKKKRSKGQKEFHIDLFTSRSNNNSEEDRPYINGNGNICWKPVDWRRVPLGKEVKISVNSQVLKEIRGILADLIKTGTFEDVEQREKMQNFLDSTENT